MTTELELQQRREQATARQEALVDLFEQFIRGPVGGTVDLGTGVIPTLQTIVANMQSYPNALEQHEASANNFLDDLVTQLGQLPTGSEPTP